MSEIDDFMKALTENEDDIPTRLAYADWLDQNGEHDEADRQRKWPAAKEWLIKFCRENNPSPDEEDPYESVISYDDLIERGREVVENIDQRGSSIYCGNNMSMCDALRENSEEFWHNWHILTGIPLPPDDESIGHFSCAC